MSEWSCQDNRSLCVVVVVAESYESELWHTWSWKTKVTVSLDVFIVIWTRFRWYFFSIILVHKCTEERFPLKFSLEIQCQSLSAPNSEKYRRTWPIMHPGAQCYIRPSDKYKTRLFYGQDIPQGHLWINISWMILNSLRKCNRLYHKCYVGNDMVSYEKLHNKYSTIDKRSLKSNHTTWIKYA